MDHFLEQTAQVLAQAVECCREGRGVATATLEQLSSEVDFVAKFLATHDRMERSPRRNHMLELLLGFANLREHLHRKSTVPGAAR
jgi:hypothetical protein